jgi:hypothetical protein
MSVTTVSKAEVAAFSARLRKWYGLFTLGFIGFVLVMLFLETSLGLSRELIGYAFLLLTLGMYAVIGVLNFTRKLDEYYVAGRKVPPFFNGMATGADWMSAASFISMAGPAATSCSRSCSRRTSASSASSRSLTSSRSASRSARRPRGSRPRSARSSRPSPT